VSAEEIFCLLPEGAFPSVDSFQAFLSEDEACRGALTVVNSEIAPKGLENLISRRPEQQNLARTRTSLATDFTTKLIGICPWIQLVALSGSTAYSAAKPADDLDFFVVASRNRIWITLLVAMLLAKVNRLRNRRSAVFCFNRAMEESECMLAFRSSGAPLFAREALNLKVLTGEDYYQELLQVAPWMQEFFPVLYHSRLSPSNGKTTETTSELPFLAVTNLAAMWGLAPYIWLVGLIRNVRLKKLGNRLGQFRTVVRRRFCAYESVKFDELMVQYRRTLTNDE
jgi:hypothetical protein